MAQSPTGPKPLGSEGDINQTERRRAWQQAQLDDATRQLLAADAGLFIHQSLSTPCLNVLAGCEGIYLTDAQGRRIMDFHGNSAHQVGYRHPRVLAAVRRQLAELPFCPRRYANRPATALARRLVALSSGAFQRVLFAPAGTVAIGMALKLVRYATGRYKTISMWGSFHGASLDAISVGGEALFRDGVGPLLPGGRHVPRPTATDDLDEAVAAVAAMLRAQGDIAAVIAEPLRCTTVEMPPAGYWPRIRQLCDQHGALLVFDEIPLALGRTGRMFCYEHFGATPDILVLGKGLGGGVLPMAAVLTRADLCPPPATAVGHYTHEKSPVGAAAALATLDVIQEEGLVARAERLGRHALRRLAELRDRQPLVAAVRGLGLALAVQLAGDGARAADQAERVMYQCLARGLSFKVSAGNVLTLTPPLTITPAELDQALDILQQSLA